MVELLTGLSAQPEFPNQDLTDNNAAMLELLLSNQDIVTESHQASERISWVFKVGHKVVSAVTGTVLDHDSRYNALDHGASLYEAMSLLLAAVPTRTSELFSVQTQAAAWMHADITQLADYQEKAYAIFTSNLPKTKEVVVSAAMRYYPQLTSYAVLGAAMAHQFELDTVA